MRKKLITQSDDLIAQGVAKKLIRIDDEGKRIKYLRHGILRDWTMSKYEVPELPLKFDLENKAILKQASLAHRQLAELKGVARTIPNENILISTLTLR